MNFSPFGSPFSSSIPTLHQFAAKLSQDNVCAVVENNSRYTANGIPSFTHHHHATTQSQATNTTTSSAKYNSFLNAQSLYGPTLGTTTASTSTGKKQIFVDQHQELTQELCNALLQNQQEKIGVSLEKIKVLDDVRLNSNLLNQTQQQHSSSTASPWQSLASTSSTVVDYLSQLPVSTLPLSLHHFLKYSSETLKKDTNNEINSGVIHSNINIFNNVSNNTTPNSNQSNSSSSLTQNNSANEVNNLSTVNPGYLNINNEPVVVRKKKKKKPEKQNKAKLKPGEIRLTTALDGSTLYCCPECHMAYPEKELLEQHLLGHTMERRFVCDICGAALKRKDHLTRHKQSHNPERPYICSVCLKAFKRKEQLTLHFVIHSGEKRHVCTECGKGFYRKDHLRKHTRSHIARRVKAELTQQGTSLPSLSTVSASNMMT